MVTESFSNFAPALVARVIPSVWDLMTPQETMAVEDLDFAGRVLAAANAELAAYVGQHRPNVAEANAATKSSCAAVSSAREPRAARTAAMAASGGIPTATR